MRKHLIIATIAIAGLFAACNKVSKGSAESSTETKQPHYSKKTTTGEDAANAHEFMRHFVVDHYGRFDTTVYTMTTHYVEALNAYTGLSYGIDSMSTFAVSNLVELGAVGEDEVPTEYFTQALVGGLPSSSFKTAITNILTSSDTGSVLMSYADSTLGALTSLTSAEIDMREGFIGVLGNSYATMQPMMDGSVGKPYSSLSAAEKAQIAKADAAGYVTGYQIGLGAGWGSAGAQIMGGFFASQASGIETQKVSGGYWTPK